MAIWPKWLSFASPLPEHTRARTPRQESLKAWTGDEAERCRRKMALRNCSYIYRSYDPDVTKLYTQRYPWMAAQTRAFVFTKKTAMTHELALLLRQWQAPGGEARFTRNGEAKQWLFCKATCS